MYGRAELADGALTSSKVPAKGLKDVVVLPDELLVAGVRTALVALDWSTSEWRAGAMSVTDVAPNGDVICVKNFGLPECCFAVGSVTGVMSTDESAGGVI